MNHLHVMPAFCEFIGELLNKYGVAAEVVGRIKRCDHTKAHQAFQASYSKGDAAGSPQFDCRGGRQLDFTIGAPS